MHKIQSIWKGNMTFDHEIGNHIIRTDAKPPLGEDSGASPKKLLLAGLAGCTGIDVASLLEKMRVEYDRFEIGIEADLTDEHPKVYSHLRLLYEFEGKEIEKKISKIEKAIRLSKERYCGVSAMLQNGSKLTWQLKLNGVIQEI